jgi:hypothetical protein
VLNLGLVILIVAPVATISLVLIGSLTKWALAIVVQRTFSPRRPDFEDLPRRLVLDFALGIAAICVVYVLATVVQLPVVPAVAWFTLAAAVGFALYRAVRGWARLGPSIRWAVRAYRYEALALAVIGAATLAFRVIPYWSELVYAGNDIRIFTLITQMISSQGVMPHSYGAYAFPSWSVATDDHLFFSGSEAMFAFTNNWMPVNTPQYVSAVTILINAAIPFAVYVLARTLFPERTRWCALGAAAVVGIFAAYPLFMTNWGGIDETLGWFLAPVVIALLVEQGRRTRWNPTLLLTAAVAFSGLIVTSPIAFAYVLAFLVPYLVESAARRTEIRQRFGSVAASTLCAILLAAPVLYWAATSALASAAVYPPGSQGWGTFQTAPLLQPGSPGGDFTRVITLVTSWEFTGAILIAGLAGFAVFRRVRWVPTLMGWSLALFLLNENGPFGLFWVKYPGWAAIFPDRPAHFLIVPLSLGTGLLIGSLVGSAGLARPEQWRELRPARLRHDRRRAAAVLLVVVVVVGASVVTYGAVQNNNDTVRFESSVTAADIDGFNWLKAHASPGDTVLINVADSGSWIPEFTGLRAFPYSELINNASVLNEYSLMTQQLTAYNYSEFGLLTNEYQIAYVFFGSSWFGGLVDPLTPTDFQIPAPAWNFVTSSNLCHAPTNRTSVDFSCGGDSATFRGPVVLSVKTVNGSNQASTSVVSVPTGQLRELSFYAGPPTFDRAAYITVVAPAQATFGEGNVLVLAINPLYSTLGTGDGSS